MFPKESTNINSREKLTIGCWVEEASKNPHELCFVSTHGAGFPLSSRWLIDCHFWHHFNHWPLVPPPLRHGKTHHRRQTDANVADKKLAPSVLSNLLKSFLIKLLARPDDFVCPATRLLFEFLAIRDTFRASLLIPDLRTPVIDKAQSEIKFRVHLSSDKSLGEAYLWVIKKRENR